MPDQPNPHTTFGKRTTSERPTTSWRNGIAEEAEELAAGTLDPECACMAGLFPEELLTATDEVLAAFETDAREELCDYIDQSLTECGVDGVALTARHGLGRYQLTDKWRRW
ncbi:hypothetical protein ACFQ9Z_00020 [Streptomyces sp. NPDC056580]|uniref:hypothetical protein n=1 Tax=Streptomyces sp. NPDC056580 TaxID=3345872 RepID=UPI0036BA15B4